MMNVFANILQGSHTGQLIVGREAMHSSSFITSTKLIVMYGLIIGQFWFCNIDFILVYKTIFTVCSHLIGTKKQKACGNDNPESRSNIAFLCHNREFPTQHNRTNAIVESNPSRASMSRIFIFILFVGVFCVLL